MSTVKALIFDFFDVIHSDPQKAWLKANGFRLGGGFAEATDLLNLGHISYDEYIRLYAKHSGHTPKEIKEAFASHSRVDHEVVELLAMLRKNYTVCLVSNAGSDEVRSLLTLHDLEDLFHHVIISAEVGVSKPDPQIFELALRLLGAEPGETIFIDDSPRNVAAATALGIGGIVHTDAARLYSVLKQTGIQVQ